MDPTVSGGLIFGGLVLLWLIQQDRRTVVSCVVVAALACVLALTDPPQSGVGQVSSRSVQR
jgi:hypothetical protein